MTSEVPVWVNGACLIVSGVTRKTTCAEVIQVLVEGQNLGSTDVKEFSIVERWKRVERPLDDKARILKVWSQWGDEKDAVRLTLKRVDSEADSGRGSPSGGGYISSLRRRKNRSKTCGKPPWNQVETLHPKRLAELGELLEEQSGSRRHDSKKKQECRQGHSCSSTGILHSTLLPDEAHRRKCCKKRNRQKVRNSENIEKLMKLILAQGATIQTQLHRLKEREEQIEYLEHETHRERCVKNGRNYLLETYLGSLGEAEVPNVSDDEEKGNDSGVHTEGGSDQMNGVCWATKKLPPEQSECSKRVSRKVVAGASDEKTITKPEKRSKSECRTNEEVKQDRCLKRTNSESRVSETREKNEEEIKNITKDNKDTIQEIQNQIELWEKILRINNKLEKEEENLVRLHVKIRKIQTENMKQAHERLHEEEEMENAVKEEHETLHQSLEQMRRELDQNSKEIYKNFTALITSDDEVFKKKKRLKELLSDLEIDAQNKTQSVPTLKIEERNKQTVDDDKEEVKNTPLTAIKRCPLVQKNLNEDYFKIHEESQNTQDSCSSRQKDETTVIETKPSNLVKAKSVKITFGEDSSLPDPVVVETNEKPKTPAPANASAKKGILKNRNYIQETISPIPQIEEVVDQSKMEPKPMETKPAEVPTTTKPILAAMAENIYGCSFLTSTPIEYSPYIYPVNGDTYHNPIYGSSGRKTDELYTTRRVLIAQSNKVQYQQPTLVTTKAQVHNDTDSNTSSETSGLSSMYSHSPTSDEAGYVYVLDTLV